MGRTISLGQVRSFTILECSTPTAPPLTLGLMGPFSCATPVFPRTFLPAGYIVFGTPGLLETGLLYWNSTQAVDATFVDFSPLVAQLAWTLYQCPLFSTDPLTDLGCVVARPTEVLATNGATTVPLVGTGLSLTSPSTLYIVVRADSTCAPWVSLPVHLDVSVPVELDPATVGTSAVSVGPFPGNHSSVVDARFRCVF